MEMDLDSALIPKAYGMRNLLASCMTHATQNVFHRSEYFVYSKKLVPLFLQKAIISTTMYKYRSTSLLGGCLRFKQKLSLSSKLFAYQNISTVAYSMSPTRLPILIELDKKLDTETRTSYI